MYICMLYPYELKPYDLRYFFHAYPPTSPRRPLACHPHHRCSEDAQTAGWTPFRGHSFRAVQKGLKMDHNNTKNHKYMGVSKNNGTPKSSILIGVSIIFTIHFGVPLFLETSIYIIQWILEWFWSISLFFYSIWKVDWFWAKAMRYLLNKIKIHLFIDVFHVLLNVLVDCFGALQWYPANQLALWRDMS